MEKSPVLWGFQKSIMDKFHLKIYNLNFTLRVSAGVTTRIASKTPAPRPAKNVLTLFFSLKMLFLSHSFDPNLTAVLGMEKSRSAAKPL